ncbi:MAG: metallophosphoesterase family protein [Fimbriimonadaceae bacterium]
MNSPRVLRIAHLTDMHVQPEFGAQAGFEKALEACQAHAPDEIFIGGDMVMDSLEVDLDRAMAQWDVFEAGMRACAEVPIRFAIGNHDVWGWGNVAKYQTDPLFGKRLVQERLEMEHTYYSFERAGWKFVVLDSTHRDGDGNGYMARLDEDQFGWLQDELSGTPIDQPVLILSHIPLFCACAFLDGDNERSGNWRVPGAWMHIDFRRIKDVFRLHPNVKVALSGHIHLADRVDYLGVSYFCNGAVCGGWWDGKCQEFGNIYSIVDLYEDGSFKNSLFEVEVS